MLPPKVEPPDWKPGRGWEKASNWLLVLVGVVALIEIGAQICMAWKH